MFAKIKNNQVVQYPILNIQQEFPNTSFPSPIKQGHLPEGYVIVENSPLPQFNTETHKAVPDGIEQVGGKWQTKHTVVPLTEEELEQRQQAKLELAKQARQSEVSALTVVTASGKVFDGNEDAQNRMSRSVNAMEDADTLPWVLADNTIAQVSRAELLEALKLSGAAMAAIWIKPYA